MAYTFIFMRNSQISKPPISITIGKGAFWLLFLVLSFIIVFSCYYFYAIRKPQSLDNKISKLSSLNQRLLETNESLMVKNEDLLIKNGALQQSIESEQIKLAELQAEANIVDKIKKESFEEIEKYRVKLKEKQKLIEFFNELMKPPVKEKMQCFNMNVNYDQKYVDYGINIVLDKKSEIAKEFLVEFRLVTGKDNIELAEAKPTDLAPDAIRRIHISNSVRLTGKVKHNNKLKGIKVLDVRIFDDKKDLVSQCWKVF